MTTDEKKLRFAGYGLILAILMVLADQISKCALQLVGITGIIFLFYIGTKYMISDIS